MREGHSEEGVFKSGMEKWFVKGKKGEHSRSREGMNGGLEEERRRSRGRWHVRSLWACRRDLIGSVRDVKF